MTTHVYQFPCLKDNFGLLLHDGATGATAAIDAPDAAAILAAAQSRGWRISDLLITHHHWDHTQGAAELRAACPGLRTIGPAKEAQTIGGLDLAVSEGDWVKIGALEARVLETPGHTLGHVAYYLEEDEIAFCGDALFSLGCGRAFEAPPSVLWHSLNRLAELPGETQVYCGHEYTEANARFALTIEPGNALLIERARHVGELRAKGEATLPTTIALERATNPFLRAEEPSVQAAVGLPGGDAAAVFTLLRGRKDKF